MYLQLRLTRTCKYIWKIYYSIGNAQTYKFQRYLEDTVDYINHVSSYIWDIFVRLSECNISCKYVLMWKGQIQALCIIRYIVVQIINLQHLLLYRSYTVYDLKIYGAFL